MYSVGDNDELPVLSGEVSDFSAKLHQTDESLLDSYSFSWKGKALSEAESRSFLAFLRSQLALKSQ
jgi:hypothetical protein